MELYNNPKNGKGTVKGIPGLDLSSFALKLLSPSAEPKG